MTEPIDLDAEAKYRLPTTKSIVMIALAAMLVIGALILSEHSEVSTNPKFTELSLVPLPLNSGNSAEAARVAVSNVSGSSIDLVLRVDQGSNLLFEQTFLHFAPGRSWAKSFERDNRLRLLATVSYVSDPNKPIRSVYLDARSSG